MLNYNELSNGYNNNGNIITLYLEMKVVNHIKWGFYLL